MTTKVTSAWLPHSIADVCIHFLQQNPSGEFSSLKKSVIDNFNNTFEWKVLTQGIADFSPDQWLTVMAPVFATQMIAVANTQPLNLRLEIVPSGPSILEKLKKLCGTLIEPDRGCKVFIISQKEMFFQPQDTPIETSVGQTDRSIQILTRRVRDTVIKGRFGRLKSNLHIVAFHIGLYKEGIVQFPKKEGNIHPWTVLVDKLIAQGSTGLQDLRTDLHMCVHYDPSEWQTILHCALAISPILLLQDKKFKGIGRSVLLQYLMQSLMKEKPAVIKEIEGCIWKYVLLIADQSVSVEDALLEIYTRISPLVEGMSALESAFFWVDSPPPPVAPIPATVPVPSITSPPIPDEAPPPPYAPHDQRVAAKAQHDELVAAKAPHDQPVAYEAPEIVAHERPRRSRHQVVNLTIQATSVIFGGVPESVPSLTEPVTRLLEQSISTPRPQEHLSEPSIVPLPSVPHSPESSNAVPSDEAEYWMKRQDFWSRLDNDNELTRETLSVLVSYTENIKWRPGQKRFIQTESLLKLRAGEWINDEVIEHFGTTWARQGRRYPVLFLNSYFSATFMYKDKACTEGSPQFHKQPTLSLNLDKKLQILEMDIKDIKFVYIAINENNEHWFSAIIDFSAKTMFTCDSLPQKKRASEAMLVVLGLAWICRTLLAMQGLDMKENEWKFQRNLTHLRVD
ncbi:hypothetical protein BDP27DRAFT_1425047 [Rhodocollybia butyracea]|uniref:Ubiquitin-like protease family profile domain-containing protein n=1 Tax=Rhodocollybia butyracea TaxID=206335 RepID=A0A9P5U313_9AGAR|nr:hypothetical protein BDP27DRAFT_1425047 [Rhodocollybia butyracea]